MSPLEKLLKQAQAKSNDCSEAKHLAQFIQFILDDEKGDYTLIPASMATFIDWAVDFKRAAEKGK